LFILGIILFIFQTGILVGYKKAFFSCHVGENYYNGFEEKGGDEPFLPNLDPEKNLPNANGAIGSIIKISLPSIIVADKDGVEKNIDVTDDTIYRQSKKDILSTDLKIGDFVVIIGSPEDNGNIAAKLIRILPPPPQMNRSNQAQSTTSPLTK
ncbi:MAG: hypothetical protein WCO18_01420, partial [bacterium]